MFDAIIKFFESVSAYAGAVSRVGTKLVDTGKTAKTEFENIRNLQKKGQYNGEKSNEQKTNENMGNNTDSNNSVSTTVDVDLYSSEKAEGGTANETPAV